MYVRQPLQDAVQEVLNILGKPSREWTQDSNWDKLTKKNDIIHSMQYEIDEAIYTLRAALGLPVPRQRCLACNARDSIYWERDPQDPRFGPINPTEAMWCHECGALEPPNEWITEVVD